jgi:hypothetical protein
VLRNEGAGPPEGSRPRASDDIADQCSTPSTEDLSALAHLLQSSTSVSHARPTPSRPSRSLAQPTFQRLTSRETPHTHRNNMSGTSVYAKMPVRMRAQAHSRAHAHMNTCTSHTHATCAKPSTLTNTYKQTHTHNTQYTHVDYMSIRISQRKPAATASATIHLWECVEQDVTITLIKTACAVLGGGWDNVLERICVKGAVMSFIQGCRRREGWTEKRGIR